MASWTIFVYICIATGRIVFLLHLSPIASLAIVSFLLRLRRALPNWDREVKMQLVNLQTKFAWDWLAGSWIDRLLCYYPTVCAVLGHLNYLPSFRLLYSSLSV